MTGPAVSLAVNARFLTRAPTGVDRVAIEVITALAARPEVGSLILLHPVSPDLQRAWIDALPAGHRAKLILRPLGSRQGYPWEQLELSRACRDLVLLSLCSTGPAWRRNQAVMIHDAQVWDVPHSYSRAFRLAYRVLLPVIAHRARHVLTVSEFSARRLEALGIAPKAKPRVVPNGADHILRVPPDPQTLARLGLAPGGYFLAIGNLAPHKNLALLIEAAAARGPDAPELIIAGGVNTSVFADAGLRGAAGVRFVGRVSDADLRALYQGAIALAFPSLTEGFGLPPVEAMLCGCPVIATTGGAVPEVCGPAALFVDPTDRAGWTAALERLADDRALRDRLSRLGREVGARYRWDHAADALLQALWPA